MKKAVHAFPPRAGATLTAIFVVSFFLAQANAQQTNPQPVSPAASETGTPAKTEAPTAGMAREVIKLGYADIATLKQMLPDITSKDAKCIFLELSRELRITDTPPNIAAVREVVKALSVPPKNVKIEVTAISIGTNRTVGGVVRGSVVTPANSRIRGGFITSNPQPFNTPGVIRQPTVNGRPVRGPVQTNTGRIIMPSGGLDIGVGTVNQRGENSSLNRLFILVRNGGTGTLEVVREVPLVDYLTRYFAGGNAVGPFVLRGPGNLVQLFAPGGTFEVPEFRWEKAGAQLLVRPTVYGNLITVEVVPQISAIVTANPQKVRNRQINTYLTGADQYVQYTRLKTTVTVANGATVTIGGFTDAPAGFNRHFFGFGNSTGGSVGSITLKATIQ
jgi:hypothetical protein